MPLPGSVLTDSGQPAPTGGVGELDVLGGVRVVGLAPDRGAIEDQDPVIDDRIFRDSME